MSPGCKAGSGLRDWGDMPSTGPDKDVPVAKPHRTDVATVTEKAANAKAKAAKARRVKRIARRIDRWEA